MSELEVHIKNLIEAIAEWKGSGVRYGEVFKKKTLTSIMQIIQQERIKAQEEILHHVEELLYSKHGCMDADVCHLFKEFDELKQSLSISQDAICTKHGRKGCFHKIEEEQK